MSDDEFPKTIEMVYVRRCVDLLSLVFNDEGQPVATYGCDCGSITEMVFEDVTKARSGTHELAFTCDGCLSSHWVTFTIQDREAAGDG